MTKAEEDPTGLQSNLDPEHAARRRTTTTRATRAGYDTFVETHEHPLAADYVDGHGDDAQRTPRRQDSGGGIPELASYGVFSGAAVEPSGFSSGVVGASGEGVRGTAVGESGNVGVASRRPRYDWY